MNRVPDRAIPDPGAWDEARWRSLEAATRGRALARPERAYATINAAARRVMRHYTTSFFIVSRFLPRDKRDAVEVIYAAVRYPDEVVDTFPLASEDRRARLDTWSTAFERGLDAPFKDNLAAGGSVFVAAFIEVVRRFGIPPDDYRSFLAAMRRDIDPAPFATLEALIDDYVYGSAVVVGYFLTHVYGARDPSAFPRAMDCARDLGIGLQLTNFLRDVREDYRCGRLYLPLDLLRGEGLDGDADPGDPAQAERFRAAILRMAETADDYYRQALENLDAFAADSRLAIQACIDVYRALNQRIRTNPDSLDHRESVPFREKWALLPASKYWRVPAAYFLDFS